MTEKSKRDNRPPEDIDPKRLDVPTVPRKRRNRAKPEPSESLRAGKAKALSRILKRPQSPGIMYEPNGSGGLRATSPHSDVELWELQLADAFGTRSSSVMRAFIGQLKRLVPDVWDESAQRSKPHETELNAALAMVADVQPRNVTEAALAAQMVAIHWMQMRLSAQALNRGYNVLQPDAAIASKLARTYTMQMEVLAKLRGKQRATRQTIKVRKELHQHVHYHDNRGAGENEGQCHETRATGRTEKLPSLSSPDAGGDVVPLPRRARKV
ncbi:MAG TPA: hypothetical protein VGE05_10880 [Novosphingobium sp.]